MLSRSMNKSRYNCGSRCLMVSKETRKCAGSATFPNFGS